MESSSTDMDSTERKAMLSYRDAFMRDLVPRLSLVVRHRTLAHRNFALPPVLPAYAQRELQSVHNREELLRSLPPRVVTTWVENDTSSEHESVAVPLTGWNLSDDPTLTLVFDAAHADMDEPPLLVASTIGAMQMATEIHLQLDGRDIRVWRYGVPSSEIRVHGKRTVRMLDAAERSELPGWHAVTLDGAGLLNLDVPSRGVDGLADVWHLSTMRVLLNRFELYRELAPKLLTLGRPVPRAAEEGQWAADDAL